MTSLTESFSLSKHTPLCKNEQKERETLQWNLLKDWNVPVIQLFDKKLNDIRFPRKIAGGFYRT